jgi:hypothetical protein
VLVGRCSRELSVRELQRKIKVTGSERTRISYSLKRTTCGMSQTCPMMALQPLTRSLKPDDDSGSQTNIVLDIGVRVGQLRAQPVGLESTEQKPMFHR